MEPAPVETMMPLEDCTNGDYPPKFRELGVATGHFGGHRKQGIYFDSKPDHGIEHIWQVYHRITEDWEGIKVHEQAVMNERLEALGYKEKAV